MVKIINPLGDIKTGRQGEAVYQRKYGQQIRRQVSPKRAMASQTQIAHRQLYRDALAWRSQLSLANRRYLDGYCIANGIVDGYHIHLPWSRFALKLYLQHIGFVIVDKPIMQYIPPYSYFVEEQTQSNTNITLSPPPTDRAGQRLTISNREVTKLAFLLYKNGSPAGDLTFEIRRVSDESLIVSKIWGLAVDLPETATWEEVEFDAPTSINEEVFILAYNPGNPFGNDVAIRIQTTDVKAAEYLVYGQLSGFTSKTDWDCAYKYTYRVEVEGKPTPDYENCTLGLLHVRHPSLLSGEHRRDGKLYAVWSGLSNLDQEYITGQVGVDVFSGDELKFTTIAGIEYSFIVP